MKIIDKKGRLFGKISILDIGALGVILLVIAGIFFLPGTSVVPGVAQGKSQLIEVDVLVRGLSVANFDNLQSEFQENKQANVVIRNQPAGRVEIERIEVLPRTTPVPQPDGTVKALPDPRPEVEMIKDLVITFAGNAEVGKSGIVVDGAKKIKIGTSIRLEGGIYDFSGSVIGIDTEIES